MATKSATRWDAEARQSQDQAEQYRDMAAAIRALNPTSAVVNEEVARMVRLAAELDEDAEYRWAEAHRELTGR